MPNLLVIPSIDIKDGKIVRVVQGIPELNCSGYGNDPVEMAMIWRAENAKCLHVVDFNAAHSYSHSNYKIVENICSSVIIPVEYGGGIKTFQDASDAFNMGVFRVVVGTMAFENPEDFQKIIQEYGALRISAAIDVIFNKVLVKGRSILTDLTAEKYALKLKELGAERFIVTDVGRNGMLTGPNIKLSKKVAQATGGKVTLSGGIGGYKDLIKVANATESGIDSVIIGRALYENRFSCQKFWRVAESGIFN
jgi:phosphoribosylformimino-5-aminoimidazole carboxamide ribotide isomerase